MSLPKEGEERCLFSGYIFDAFPFDFIHFHYCSFTVKCKAVYIFNHQSFQGLDKKCVFLQKSSYEDSAVCAFLYAYMCVFASECASSHCL